jgi:hypothetical protein
MKNILKILLATPLVALFASCDEVDVQDRYIEVEPVVAKRAVLLEEFTGQRCVNCPDAHAVIQSLKEQYGDSFIPVSIHGGPTSLVYEYKEGQTSPMLGLKLDEGDYYAQMWNVSSIPCGVIDRTSGVQLYSQWATTLLTELTKETPLNIELSAAYNADTDAVDVTTTLQSTENIDGKLQIWVLESGIVALQYDGSKRVMDYVHNHVFRASVTDKAGEAISLQANVFPTVNHSIAVRNYWNHSNLNVVAFVFNDSGVVQAAECEVVVPEE